MSRSVDTEINLNVHEDCHDSRLRKSSSSIANRFIFMKSIQFISYHLCFMHSEFSSLAFKARKNQKDSVIFGVIIYNHLHLLENDKIMFA